MAGGLRIQDHGQASVLFYVDGQEIEGREGDTIASAWLAAGFGALRRTLRSGEPRSIFCGMGVCFDCVVTVDGVRGVRACMTPVRAGMQVKTR